MLASSSATGMVHAVGDSLHAEVERHPNPDGIDHVWITMDVGQRARWLVSINTRSKRNRDAGFDERIRVGLARTRWESLPPPLFEPSHQLLDYGSIESATNVFYETLQRTDLEKLLLDFTLRAVRLEVWGTSYINRDRQGIHQIHSMRASCAVAADFQNRDGALKFYFQNKESTLVLLKFCGQP